MINVNTRLTITEIPLSPRDHLERFGYVLISEMFEPATLSALAEQLSITLHGRNESSVLRSRGQVYGSRNLLEAFPEVCSLVKSSSVRAFATEILGQSVGMVRVLYFDKPPDRSWSLPWHRDQTIAVKRNDLPSHQFRKPTVKAGVPHVEAPMSLLANMLTLRIHLDPMTKDNGPLSVVPGSHRVDDPAVGPPIELHAKVGDVLAMRPLLSHSSSMSRPGTTAHRRVIHFELAPCAELADGYEWHAFVPLAEPRHTPTGRS